MSQANPLIAQVQDNRQWFTGIGYLESIDALSSGLNNGSWIESGLGAGGVVLEAASLAWDPVGTLLRYAASWLMEYLEPSRRMLDKLGGNPPVIEAYAGTWTNVSKAMAKTADDIEAAVRTDIATWHGDAADTYREQAGEKITGLREAAKLCETSGKQISMVGMLVGVVRTMVREAIAALVAWLVKSIGLTVLTGPFGASEAVRTAVSEIGRVTTMITNLVAKLMRSLANLKGMLPDLVSAFDRTIAKLAPKGGRAATGDVPAGAVRPAAAVEAPPRVSGDAAPHASAPDAPTAPAGATPDIPTAPKGDAPASGGRTSPAADDAAPVGGQRADGNNGVHARGGDPVDAVSGQMITSGTDAELPGLLPLVLQRAYASGYRHGGLHGPGWSSTLDQRLEFDPEGIRYFGDDAQVLWYPWSGRPDESVLPTYGARWPLRWDGADDTYRIEDPTTGWTLHFDPNPLDQSVRPVSALTDRDGHRIDYLRDDDGLPVAVTHSGGYAVDIATVDGPDGARISAMQLLDNAAPGGVVPIVSYRYDTRGRLTGVVDSSGVPYRYEYDDADRIVAWHDRNDFAYRYVYGEDGRVVLGEGLGGYLSSRFDYDLDNRVTTVTDSLGHATRYHYDEHNHVTAVVDPLGNTERLEFDEHRRLLSHTDPLGNTTRYVRDEHGDPVRIEQPDGTRVDVEYDPRWRMPTRVTRPGDAVWRYTYSATGNLLTTTDPLGAVASRAQDGHGHMIASTAADGQRWTFTSDGPGRPLSITGPLGDTTRYSYDGFGRLRSWTDVHGAVTRYGYTIEGRLAWQVDPDGNREELSYDRQGNLVASRTALGTTTFAIGPFGRVVARTAPDGTRHTFAYDTELRLVTVTNPAGLTWDYEYDAAGNRVSETDFDGRRTTYRHDKAGRVVGHTVASGPSVELVRDAAGRVVAEHVDGEPSSEFEYDPAGLLRRASNGTVELRYERDPLGRPIQESIDGRTVRSEFDLSGRLTRRLTPSGVESVWRYTPQRREIALAGSGGAMSFERDAAGREVTRRLGPAATLTQGYDEQGRLTAQQLWAGGGSDPRGMRPVQQRGYRYRSDGVVTAIQDRLGGDRGYELTAIGRVTAVTGATWTERYVYDVLGNLAAAQPGTQDDTAGPRTHDGLLLRSAGRGSYEYDPQGRLVRQTRRTLSGQRRVWTYGWNGRNQLTMVTTPDGQRWRYGYDPIGRRVAKQRVDESGSVLDEVTFSWDGDLLAEQLTGGARVTATTWDYRTATGEPVAQTSRSWLADAPDEVIDTRFHAIVSDLVGSPTELVDPAGHIAWRQTMSLWGNQIAVSTSDGTDCPLRFPGQYHDRETGLHYNHHRYYDSATARYLTPDPLGLVPSPNNYAYVVNPLVVCDPLGLAGQYREQGKYAVDPNKPPGPHTGSSEYPHDFSQETKDEMAKRWTDEGRRAGAAPVDGDGVRVPHDQLTWRDAQGNKIPHSAQDPITFDHEPSQVRHWVREGHDQSYAQRETWHDNPDNLSPMTRSENGRKGAMETARYADAKPGPNYSGRGSSSGSGGGSGCG